jgi:hydroxyethylthiazole kinase-like uncharacterized protein yjeF
MVMAALRGERAVVIDADGLTSFAEGKPDGRQDKDELFAALAANGKAVLTPHSGEFHRLFDGVLPPDSKAHLGSKADLARAAARRSGAVVVFKGADTVIAAPDGRAAINANAPPWLATAGAGDVLAGMIAGMLAQDVPAFEATCIGVWTHGDAGREAGPGLIAEDLPEVLPAVFRHLYDEFGIDY